MKNSGGSSLSPEFVLLLTDAQPRLFGYLLKRLGQVDQAHEVLQEVNVVLCGKASEFELGSDFMAWAFTVSRFQLLAFRKRVFRDRLVFSDDLAESLERVESTLSDTRQSYEIALRGCVKKLSEADQQLIVRRYAESISVKAIAAELGKTANAISISLHRIRKQLMTCVELKLSESN